MEVKDPTKKPSQRALTDDEGKFFMMWRGQVWVIETIDEALSLICNGSDSK
jgi:hypothetical protein